MQTESVLSHTVARHPIFVGSHPSRTRDGRKHLQTAPRKIAGHPPNTSNPGQRWRTRSGSHVPSVVPSQLLQLSHPFATRSPRLPCFFSSYSSSPRSACRPSRPVNVSSYASFPALRSPLSLPSLPLLPVLVFSPLRPSTFPACHSTPRPLSQSPSFSGHPSLPVSTLRPLDLPTPPAARRPLSQSPPLSVPPSLSSPSDIPFPPDLPTLSALRRPSHLPPALFWALLLSQSRPLSPLHQPFPALLTSRPSASRLADASRPKRPMPAQLVDASRPKRLTPSRLANASRPKRPTASRLAKQNHKSG